MSSEASLRASVDVVVPFLGSPDGLSRLVQKLNRLEVGPDDSITVVDNAREPNSASLTSGDVRVAFAPDRQSSYFARNRGARGGKAEWILFIDADVEPAPDLLRRYFERPPNDDTGILAGGVREVAPPAAEQTLASRYTVMIQVINPVHTLAGGEFGYAVTANCAIRRSAFDAVGGFADRIRSGGDADICFRIKRAGWALEARPEAEVVHRGRTSTRALVRQMAKHGSGIEWLDRKYPGFANHPTPKELARVTVTSTREAAAALARRDKDRLAHAVFYPLHRWVFWSSRWISNDIR